MKRPFEFWLINRWARQYTPPQKIACAASWLHRLFFFSTISLNIPYQIIGDIQRNGRKLLPDFAAFLKSIEKNANYSQKVHILAGNGTLPVPTNFGHLERIPYFKLSEVLR